MVDFGPPSGPEQAGERPAIVLQEDVLNDALVTTIVIPLPTNLKRLALPTTVMLPAGEAGLPKDSVALCHQIQVRGNARLTSRPGKLSEERLGEIEPRVLDALGL